MKMNVMLSISLCLFNHAVGVSAIQQAKLESLKSLIFNNVKATVTLNSTDLKQLLNLSRSTSVSVTYPKHAVGFSVYVKKNDLTPGNLQTLIYDRILTNEGNGYDDRTGVFTCPVAGTYMFVVDSLSRNQMWLHMKLNKTTVALLHGDSHNGNPLIQMSRTVLLRLKVGDHVKVVCTGKSSFINAGGYSGFTGTFLF